MILDSNIIIYANQPQYFNLFKFLKENEHKLSVSIISQLEVLGYHKLKNDERYYYEQFFNAITILPIDNQVIMKAIELKQKRKMTVGDAVIAATAIIHKLPIVTNNVRDFDKINVEIIAMSDLL